MEATNAQILPLPTSNGSAKNSALSDIIKTPKGVITIDRKSLILCNSPFSDDFFELVAASLKRTFPAITSSWLDGFKRVVSYLGYCKEDIVDVIEPFYNAGPFPGLIPSYRLFMKPVSKVPLYSLYDVHISCTYGGISRSTFGIIHEDEKGPVFALSADIKKFNMPTIYRASINLQQRFS